MNVFVFDNLNDEQISAVKGTEGYCRVIAGAGSGKTRVLTHRFVHLVENLGIATDRILCVTFTNKAAKEMKRRIRGMIGDKDLGYVCTFHGFAVQFLIDGVEAQQHELSYDKILKNTLTNDDKMTIRFINGLFGDDIPLDAPVEWLDKESVSSKNTAIIADFYPRIDGRMYAIEVEQDGKSGDMALRVFKYAVGGAMLHNTASTRTEVNMTFPQPCVIFLRGTRRTPKKLIWNIEFFDGQKVTLEVPAIRLNEFSVKEIADKDLFPIGQFYMRTFNKVTDKNLQAFMDTATSLLAELRSAMEREDVPPKAGLEMQDTIRKTFENVIFKSRLEGEITMTTNITETLPWIDYSEVFKHVEKRGEAKGKAERDLEIALKAFEGLKRGMSADAIIEMLREFGIPEPTIGAAHMQAEAELASKS